MPQTYTTILRIYTDKDSANDLQKLEEAAQGLQNPSSIEVVASRTAPPVRQHIIWVEAGQVKPGEQLPDLDAIVKFNENAMPVKVKQFEAYNVPLDQVVSALKEYMHATPVSFSEYKRNNGFRVYDVTHPLSQLILAGIDLQQTGWSVKNQRPRAT